MAFSSTQLQKLCQKLDRQDVHTRSVDGKNIDYIEGWFAIAEANSIFGFGGWDRETVHFEKLFERTRDEVTRCAYLARVRIAVRAGASRIVREGTGFGSAVCRSPSDALERAIKAAETDATKRALVTFGNRFGLGLYDKGQLGVTTRAINGKFTLRDAAGATIAADLSGEAFCSGLRQVIEKLNGRGEFERCRTHNAEDLTRLQIEVPKLCSEKGEHFSQILERLFSERLKLLSTSAETGSSVNLTAKDILVTERQPEPAISGVMPALHTAVDKASLSIGITRRMRDKDHLRQVATLPCVVCEQFPSHAHHLTFAQPRGLGLKVSDEFVVPLCAIHHNELHRSGAEELWWKRLGIEPLSISRSLWEAKFSTKSDKPCRVA